MTSSNSPEPRVPEGSFPLLWALVAAVAVTILDQVSKLLVERAWPPNTHGITVVPRVVELVHYRNPGGAWGLFGDFPLVLTAISAGVLLLVLARLRTLCMGHVLPTLSIGLLMGGVLGNLIDRLRHSEVIDFLVVYLGSYEWPAFNVADSAICVGVGLYAVSCWRLEQNAARGGKPVDRSAAPPSPLPERAVESGVNGDMGGAGQDAGIPACCAASCGPIEPERPESRGQGG